MVAVEVLVDGVEGGGVGEQTRGFAVAIARGEVEAVGTAKIEDGGSGAGLIDN